MVKIKAEHKAQIANVTLRLVSLGVKLIFTLYMGRFFALAEIGTYGLVFSAAMLVSAFLGQNLSSIVMREIVDAPPIEALSRIRDEVIWYGANYALLIVVALAALAVHLIDVPTPYVLFVVVLGVLENLGTNFYDKMNALNQQFLSNIVLFVRSAGWIPVVIGLGVWDEKFRTADTVLVCWTIGSLLSLTLPLWTWNKWRSNKPLNRSVDWGWLRTGIPKGFRLWLGAMALTSASYVDRYVINHYLSLDLVGVVTFYYSFVNALFPLIESGVLSFAYPRLVGLQKRKDIDGFWREVKQTFWQTSLGGGALAIAIGIFVPIIATFLGKEALLKEISTLWLLLAGTWLHGLSLVATCILFAQHRDKPIWAGSFIFLFAALCGNFIFVPWLGFIGIGISSIVCCSILLTWRYSFALYSQRT